MSHSAIILGLLAAIAALSATAAVIVIKAGETSTPAMTEEQRAVRKRFFGSNEEPRPIEKGQEMRPRW